MPLHRRRSLPFLPLLALVLLNATGDLQAAGSAPVLGDEVCEAPFVLSVPADLVRSHGSLVVMMHYDAKGQWLACKLFRSGIVVTVRQGGKVTELGRAAAPLPERGQSILLKRQPDGLAVAYGSRTVLRLRAKLPEGGHWGLLGAPAAALRRLGLQPTDTIDFSDDFMRMPEDPSVWEALSGAWRVAQLQAARYSANAFTLVGKATSARPALTTAGQWFWEDLTVEASVRPSPQAGGFGVAAACQSDGACYLLRFVPRARPYGVVQLVRVLRGRSDVLDEAPASASPQDWHRLSLSAVAGRLGGAFDGTVVVSAAAPSLAHGKIGLWAAGPQEVAFDDVEAYSGDRRPPPPVVLSHELQAADPAAQAFIADPYMQEWADERDQWLGGGTGLWHAGYYWGDVELTWDLPEGGLSGPSQLHLCVPARGDTFGPPADVTGGCHLEIAPAAGGQLGLTLTEGQRQAQKSVAMPQSPTTVGLRRVGSRAEAVVGDVVVVTLEVSGPAAGKVGFTGSGARRAASRLAVTSTQVADSAFRKAPTDWTIGGGEWGVASRWACSPRWSWFQGRSEDLASIWTRRRFTGDLVVEFFAGVSMDQPWAPFYRHPGDLAVTLGGSDSTPGSGYSLVFGGWGNTASGIYRRDRLVAQVPGIVMPDIVDSLGGTAGREGAHELHNEWRRIRAERIGRTVRLSVDGRTAVSFEDPEPLAGGSVGIWTLEQGLTVARARIYYQGLEQPAAFSAPPPPLAPQAALQLPSFGPPRVTSTFEDGIQGWHAAVPGSLRLALTARGGPADGRCLQIANVSAGGRFALASPIRSLDLRTHHLLFFDYAIPPEVKIDLFATVGGQRYRLAVSGTPEPVPGCDDLGRLPGASADGAWHSAEVDLLSLLRAHDRETEGPPLLEALEFAAYAAPVYLRAGIGGNPAGASWRLDNFSLGGVTAAPVRVPVPAGVSVGVTGGDFKGGTISAKSSGRATLRFSSKAAAATDLLAFDLEPPTLAPVDPQPGARWCGPALTVALRDAGPAGLDERSVELRVAGRRFDLTDPALQWQPLEGLLTLDLAAVNPALPPGPTEVSVAAADRAGHAVAPLRFTFTFAPQVDATSPTAPVLAGLPAARLDCDFESGTGGIGPWGADAGVALRRAHDPTTGQGSRGSRCLEIRSTKLGGLYGLSLGAAPFEASRYPLLEFDYRAPRELRVDLIVEIEGRRRVIKFTDNDQTWPVIGTVGATADDRWHHAMVDLQGLLSAALGRSAPLVVTDLAFASSGWPGTRQGLCWYLDNVRLSAALNPRRLPAGLTLRSQDNAGVNGYAWSTSVSPGGAPPAAASAPGLAAALAPASGLVWLHAAAVDAAGNRSPVAHLPLRLAPSDDAVPPVISSPLPSAGAAACPETVSARIADEASGVSPADLRLTVDGRVWTVADEALAWAPATGTVTWRLPAGVPLGANGAHIQCCLKATDLAGNAAEPLTWSFTLDRTQDREPPAAPAVSYLPARTADRNDFERDTGHWGNFLAAQVLRCAAGGAAAPGCLELRHLEPGRQSAAYVLMRDFGDGWRECPCVRFRYRAKGLRGATLQLLGTTFDGAADQWTPLGSFTAGGDDWQAAEVDVAAALSRVSPTLDIHRLFLTVALPPDGAVLVDDYAMYSEAASTASFAWSAPASASGLAGYSWVLDAAETTVPPEKVRGTAQRAEFGGLKPGRYVFHVRACDGAGNWGATAHVAVILKAAH